MKRRQNSARNNAKCSQCFQFLCNNIDRTWFFNALTFTRSPATVFNTSHGTWRMLMHEKPCLISILFRTTSGFPLSIQNKTFVDGPCPQNTGWTIVADTDLTWSVCSTYAPHDQPEPYFKYSRFTRIANLTTGMS